MYALSSSHHLSYVFLGSQGPSDGVYFESGREAGQSHKHALLSGRVGRGTDVLREDEPGREYSDLNLQSRECLKFGARRFDPVKASEEMRLKVHANRFDHENLVLSHSASKNPYLRHRYQDLRLFLVLDGVGGQKVRPRWPAQTWQ